MAKKAPDPLCPCGSSKHYEVCCGVFHTGTPAPTAETLMRSRYTAYALGLEDYLLQTWHADTRPAVINLNEDPPIKWIGLQIQHVQTDESTATVEFVARYKIGGKAERLHESSHFIRQESRWLYLSDDMD